MAIYEYSRIIHYMNATKAPVFFPPGNPAGEPLPGPQASFIQDKLNELGADGWELVAIDGSDRPKDEIRIYWLKREAQRPRSGQFRAL
jgi:hypothetical protein